MSDGLAFFLLGWARVGAPVKQGRIIRKTFLPLALTLIGGVTMVLLSDSGVCGMDEMKLKDWSPHSLGTARVTVATNNRLLRKGEC